jgi:14-3-3 protein epsilon
MSLVHVHKTSRTDHLFLAKLAEEAERYQDVIVQIKNLIHEFDAELTIDERNLLSVAFKNVTNALRNSWRIADALEKAQTSRSNPSEHLNLLRRQRERIELELTDVCKDIVSLLEEHLLPSAPPGEETVFYLKMKGDYYRYLAEFAQKRDRERYADFSLTAYKLAYRHALSTLEPTHPTRLGLALNFSVFYHDVIRSPERACHLAKHAFDEAINSLNGATIGQAVRDSLMILQLLRDDMVLWLGEIRKASETS